MLYPSYIQSYIERDVRQLINLGDLHAFQLFLQLCAGRIGQLFNYVEIAGACGISASTARRWLSVLEAGYILFILQPYYRNFNKRITKSPKIYFYDTGPICSLLKIETDTQLFTHPLRGNIFENFVIADLCKQYYNLGQRPPLYFWRDLNGRIEIDCIIEEVNQLYALEIKSGETIRKEFFDGLKEWSTLSDEPTDNNYLVYAGDLEQKRTQSNVLGVKKMGNLIQQIKQKQ
jgi:uncharacterized protein